MSLKGLALTTQPGQLKTEDEQSRMAYTNNNYSQKELSYLANTFTVGAVAALQIGGQREWIHFREILLIVQPIGKILLEFSQVQHYLQRVTDHLYDHLENLGGFNLIQTIDNVFPDFKYSKQKCIYPTGTAAKDHKTTEETLFVTKRNSSNTSNVLFKLDVDVLQRKLQPKQLRIVDIHQHLPRVVSEIAKHESIWKNCLGLTLVAANTDIPCDILSNVNVSTDIKQYSKKPSKQEENDSRCSKIPKTAFEVVESLVRQESVDATKIWYLNFSDTQHYKPYDLDVVSKHRVNSEHFVISVFGVLHVKPNGESELIPLGQWYREATLYKTIKKIKFFKTYLIFKSYMLWRDYSKFKKFSEIRKQVKEIHLLEVPSMREAIIKINQLLVEMESIPLFPSDQLCCYSLEKFNDSVSTLLSKAQKSTEILHSHSQTIISKVQDDCLEYLRYCKFQLEQKSNNIKESMTVAKHRRDCQMHQLNVAKYITDKLPCFARLIELMLHEFMIQFVSRSISGFVHKIMKIQNEGRKGLFYASFKFELNTNVLTMSPDHVHLKNYLKQTIGNASSVLSASCVPMILPNVLNVDLDQKEKNEHDRVVLSTTELQTLLNCGPKAANDHFHKQGNENSKFQVDGVSLRPIDPVSQEQAVDEDKFKVSLQGRIDSNKEVQDCQSAIHTLLTSAFAEVEEFKQKHIWISNIHKFVSSWNHDVLETWQGQSASKIEKQVQQIKTWIEQVFCVQHSLATSNGLLFVDVSGIQDLIIPGLEAIFTELMDMTAQRCLLSSEKLIYELHRLSEMLSTEASTMNEFTSFYIKLKQCKEEAIHLHNRVEYTNSIFEVVRHCYRQLTADEEETEEKLHTEWDSFQYALQAAKDKFNSLSPQMLENLERLLSELEDEALEITAKVTGGKFLEADEDPNYILPELKELHERFIEIKEQLLKLAECKEVVADEPHDLTTLESMHVRITARHELWKYCEVSGYTIKEWLQTSFNKIQIKKVTEKVCKWKEAAIRLRQDIPANDEVLQSWMSGIEDFGTDLPLLLELSSVPLKARHWKWLFAGLGQIYDQSYQYLITDLVNMGIRDHSNLVASICDGAAAEHALESHLKKLTKKWEVAEFKLMKHFQTQRKMAKRETKLRKERLKLLKGSKTKYKSVASSFDMFIITGVNELQSQVEDNLVTLQSMLVSPNLAENTSMAETWSGHLHQLKEILDLWITCQQKWLYLGKIFSDESMSKLFLDQQREYEEVDLKYKEHMSAVLNDPKVLSVLEKKRGEIGFRDLQGEHLRTMFFELISKEEAIIKSLSSYLEGVRSSFPRLYFLGDNDILELLASTRNPKNLIPFVKKCFPGIANLKFVLPQSLNNRVRTQLDVALNADKLEVVSFYGKCGEEVILPDPLVPNQQTELWLRSIENAMKSVLWTKMGQCIEERMLCTPCVKQLMKGIGMVQETNETQNELPRPTSARRRLSLDESHKAFWYMVYPFQCVVAAEEVIWTSKVRKSVDVKGFENIQDVRTWVEGNIEHYSTAIQSSLSMEAGELLSRKAHLLIQSLLTRSLYQREVTHDLNSPDVSSSSFEWMQALKYEIDISYDKRRRIRDRHGKIELLHGASNTAFFGSLSVNQLNISIPYGYEYHGPVSRMVITPMTDRCLLNLATSFKMRYTGMVFGPAQTGKTEIIQELSKSLGLHLVTFSCNSTLPLSKVLHLISGAIQSGSMICFENVTCLPIAILSVLGQHLDNIRHALRLLEQKKFSQFEARAYKKNEDLSHEQISLRKRGVTVISLHTLVVNNEYDFDINDNKKETRRSHRARSNSVSEITNISDPRVESRPPGAENITVTKSEMAMKTTYLDLDESVTNKYQRLTSLGNVMFDGQLMTADPLFGCFMTVSSRSYCQTGIPDNLRSTMRPSSMILPEYRYITEALLISNGFRMYSILSKKIFAFKTMLQDQFFDDPVYTLGLGRLKSLVSVAGSGYKKLKSKEWQDLQQGNDASKQSTVDEEKMEEYCIGQAIHTLMSSSINPLEYACFVRLLKVSFPACKDTLQDSTRADELLLSSVKEQLVADSLMDKKELVDKVMQLHATMHINRSIILLGDSGSGKTVCYQTLCRALCQFYSTWSQAVKQRRQQKNKKTGKQERTNTAFSKVNLSTLFHKAMTSEELFGGINSITKDWSDGLFSKLLRNTVRLQNSDADPSVPSVNDSIQYWFVFDGQLDNGLTGKLESLLDDRNELCLTNGERIKAPDSVRFLFETTNLRYASPAIISRSAVVNFECDLVDWKCLFYSWEKTARNKFNISGTGIKVVEDMLDHINEPLLEFLGKGGSNLVSPKLFQATNIYSSIISSISEISSILQMLTAILDRFLSRENAERALRKESMTSDLDARSRSLSITPGADAESRFVTNAFAFSFVWAVAGRIRETFYQKFDTFTRQLFATCSHSAIFPCSIFGSMFNPLNGELHRYQEKSADIPRSIPSQSYTVSSEIEKYFTVADLLVSSGSHVLIAGEQGVGKTSFVKNLLSSKHKFQQIYVSQGLTPQYLQQQIQNFVLENQNRYRTNPLKPPPQLKGPGTNNSLVFIDDVSLAAVDSDFGNSHPTLEVLRQIISEGGVYDRERKYFQHLPHLQIVGASVHSGCYGSRSLTLSPRLTRRMNVINMVALSDESLRSVYTSVYKAWLEEFPAYSLTHIEPFAKALAYASVDMYTKVKNKIVSSPSCPHYVFSQHDLARIAKGVFIYSPKSRLKPQNAVKGFISRGHGTANESMPELAILGQPSLPDLSQSTSNINQNHASQNIEYTPAAISPLIRVIIRLWCHEVSRSFYDRIIDNADKEWFSLALHRTVVASFCGNVDEKPVIKGSAILQRESSTLEKKNNNKNRVKFKDIESSRQSDYRGPLISFKELVGEDGELMKISFSKHLFIYGSRGVEGVGDHEKGYIECLDEHLEEGLRKSLHLINSSQDKHVDLVLYRDSLHQAVKVSRILALPGGHALLISVKGHGRANIVKLVAKLANIKVMNVNGGALKCRKIFHSIVKDACFVAGLQGKPVILFISEGLNREGWEDVAAMLNEGTCPGLYTPEELSAIGNHLLPGGQVGQRRTENKTVAQERFLRRIRSNLHIFMCAWYGSLPDIVRDFPTILSRAACVDIYREWNTDVLKEVAEKWLIEKGKNEFFYRVSWNLDERERQLTAIYSLMAKFHLEVRAALETDFREAGLEVFSPLKFVEFVDLFRTVCNTICDEKGEELARLRCATNKVEEGKRYIKDVENRISEMTPLYSESQKQLATSEANVKISTKEYHESRNACDDQQKQIDQLELPLKILKEEAHEEIGKLCPVYEAAMKALQSLDIHDVEEIRSYRKPPAGVKNVADVLCMMFNKPANWDEAKLMLIRENFFQELLFYNKDEVPDNVYMKLKKYYDDPETSAESLLQISRAASSLSTWIRAVYEYCNTLRSLDPKKRELKEAERHLNNAKALLGEKRVRCNQLKSSLEDEIRSFKENMKKTRNLEKQIQTMTRAKKRANSLLDSMDLYIDHWQERTRILKRKIETAPGDSLLIAAIVCYLGTFEQDARDKLMQSWLDTCRRGVHIGSRNDLIKVAVDDNFSVVDILSSDDEQTGWKKKGLPSDRATVLNALITRTCCFAAKKCWPILIDPHDQAIRFVRGMEESTPMPESLAESVSSVQQGRSPRNLLSAILMQKFASYNQSQTSRHNTRGNQLETPLVSDALPSMRDGPRLSMYSSLDDRDSEMARTPDTVDSAMSNRRPKTAYSSFSAITNESVFLKKFYLQAGLKDESGSPPPSPLFNVGESTLLVVDADCQDIDRKLKASMAKGIPILVTHLERGIHGTLLTSVLNRNISVSNDGHFFLAHGKKKFDYHPNFRLYISASVPMAFNKTNRFVLPLHKSIVVNMSISQEGLTDQLLSLTISSERPELESQRRSLELDLFYLRQERRQIQGRVLDMIIALPGKILDETSLPEVMAESKDQLSTTRERHEEGKNYKKELDARRVDYHQVASHASALYNVVLGIARLRPCYDMPLYFFIDLFKQTLRQAKRSKSESGAVTARAAELNAKFTTGVYNRICMNVFKEDAILFPLLVVTEKLVKEEKITVDMYIACMTLIASIDGKIIGEEEIENEVNIKWLPKDIVDRVSSLAHFREFEKLLESFEKQENQWKEYFNNSPNLICSCPSGFNHLGTFHKALLWIAVKPDKLLFTIQNLILCHVGPMFTRPVNHYLENIYHISEPKTPVLVLLPSKKGEIIKEDPSLSIQSLGKIMKIPVITLCLGLKEQVTEVVRSIKDAVKKQCWVVLQNCHLETSWSSDFLRLIEDITNSEDTESDLKDEDSLGQEMSKSNFRLWLIMNCNVKFTIPVALARKGLRVAWDETTWSVNGLPLYAYSRIHKVTCETKKSMNELSVLHYKNLKENEENPSKKSYNGSTSDLRFGMELITDLSIIDDSLGYHSLRNADVAQFFEKFMFKPITTSDDSITNPQCNAEGATLSESAVLVRKQDGSQENKVRSPRHLQMSIKSLLQKQYQTDNIDRASKNPNKLMSMIPELINIYDSLSRKSSHSSKSLYQFFYREIKYLREICWEYLTHIESTSNTAKLSDRTIFGIQPSVTVADSTKTWRECLDELNLQSNEGDNKHLLNCLGHISRTLLSYIRPRSRQPLGYDVSVIPHPRGFFASILEDFCNEHLADIGNVTWECQVLVDKKDLLPPISGVYLRNLKLDNMIWSYTDNLVHLNRDSDTSIPILHLIPFKNGKSTLKNIYSSHIVSCPLIMYTGNRRINVITVNIRSSVDQISVTKNNVSIVGNSSCFYW